MTISEAIVNLEETIEKLQLNKDERKVILEALALVKQTAISEDLIWAGNGKFGLDSNIPCK